MSVSIKCKTVLITGGADGLGREFSRLYAAKGYRLVMVDIRRAKLERIADSLKHEYGAAVVIIVENPSAKNAAARIARQLKNADVRIDELLTRDGFRIYGPFCPKDLLKELDRVCAEYRSSEHHPRRSGPAFLPVGI